MNNPKILALFTILLWSFAGMLGKFISLKSQFLLLSLSFSFTFITLLLYAYIQNKDNFLQIFKKIKYTYLFIGLFGYGIYWLGYISCFHSYKGASEPIILNYTWPVFTVLFTELFYRTKKIKTKTIYGIEVLGIFFGFLSVIILATQGNIYSFHVNNLPGLAWGLLAGSSYGFFSAYSSSVPKEKQSVFLLSSILSSLVFMVFLSWSELSIIPTLTIYDFIIVALLGSVVDGLGYIFWTRANRIAKYEQISISSVASIIFFLPLLSLIIISIVFNEKTLFQPYFIVTLLLLLLSSIFCQKANELAKAIQMK